MGEEKDIGLFIECLANVISMLFLGEKLLCFLLTAAKYTLIFSGTEFCSSMVLPNMNKHLKLNIGTNVVISTKE